MSKTVTVRAAKPFTLDGRAYRAGELVICRMVQAIVLGRRGCVVIDAHARPVYQTRDMVAVPAAVAAVWESSINWPIASAPPAGLEAPKRGRGRPRKDGSR
jgi:hypothetical protein